MPLRSTDCFPDLGRRGGCIKKRGKRDPETAGATQQADTHLPAPTWGLGTLLVLAQGTGVPWSWDPTAGDRVPVWVPCTDGEVQGAVAEDGDGTGF